jgi:hypothetical protein
MTLTTPQSIDNALETLQDGSLSPEDHAGAWAVLYEVQRRIRRALGLQRRKGEPNPADELIAYMESEGLKKLGPLSVKWTAFDVAWPVNDPGNWTDSTTQDLLQIMRAAAPEYIRHIPDHLEVDTAKLGEAVHMGDPVALQIHGDLKAQHLRTEGGRRASLAVQEVKGK